MTKDQHGVTRPVVTRSYASLSQAAEENGQSRIYLGIHWRFDKVQGIQLGQGIADYVIQHVLLPIANGAASATTSSARMSLDISTFVQLASADNNLAAPVSAVPLAEPTQASPAPASDAAPSQGTEQDTIGPVLDTPTMTAEAADEVFGALDPLHERWSLPL